MAQDYEISSSINYLKSDGSPTAPTDYPPGTFIGGTATDDGTWDLADPSVDAGAYLYTGHYIADGHLFLVFENATQYSVTSPTATTASSGYPANYNASPPTLTTTPLATCFAAGTMIATPDGERAVEDLEIGDNILTESGAAVPVRWIGRQTLHGILMGAKMQPVRFKAGALGNGLPHADLTVTADHGMVIEGLVINASALINGDTIDWVPQEELGETFTVYHVETESHDVILANGAPAETFIDYIGRTAFDNHQEYLDLYGAERIIREMPAPRISAARLVPAEIGARLNLTVDEQRVKLTG